MMVLLYEDVHHKKKKSLKTIQFRVTYQTPTAETTWVQIVRDIPFIW